MTSLARLLTALLLGAAVCVAAEHKESHDSRHAQVGRGSGAARTGGSNSGSTRSLRQGVLGQSSTAYQQANLAALPLVDAGMLGAQRGAQRGGQQQTQGLALSQQQDAQALGLDQSPQQLGQVQQQGVQKQQVATVQQSAGDGAFISMPSPPPPVVRCPAVSRELFVSRAGTGGTAMIAVMNAAQWDFGLNWMHHVKAVGIDYYVVAAADLVTSERLVAAAEPCFEWFDDEAPKLGLEWGQEGWRRMTWSKVFVLDAVVDYGLNLVISDVDVVWFKDPRPLMAEHPDIDLIFGLDHGYSASEVGDSGLEREFHPNHADFNTGVYTLRYSANISAWAHAWAAYFKECDSHDQVCCYRLIRTGEGVGQLPPPNQHISIAWHGRIRMAVMPVSIFQSGHTRFVQQLHKAKQVEPYVVHATWTYNGLGGKRVRLRDMGLWVDPPEYYSQPSFLTVDLDEAEEPTAYNRWNENEDMITLHLATLQRQLQQAYVGMALAAAAGRPFILPKFQCFCEKTWYGTVRCRIFDAQEFPLPITCPTDYLFQPDGFLGGTLQEHGSPLDVREPPFLEHPRTPKEVKSSVLIILPSAALKCQDCVKEQKGPGNKMVLLVPPALRSGELLPLLEPYRSYRVWRLKFSGVGSTQRAYSGFSDEAQAQAFDRRMAHITTTWCCRQEEELKKYHREGQIEVRLTMMPDFNYSSSFSSHSAGAAAATTAFEGASRRVAGAVGAGVGRSAGGEGGGRVGDGGEGAAVQ